MSGINYKTMIAAHINLFDNDFAPTLFSFQKEEMIL